MNDDFKNYIQLLIDNKDKITHLPERDIHNLLDYITNLQETIDFQDKWLEYYKNFISENNIKDYKSRCEKAVEYIKNTPLYETTYDYNMEEELEIQNVSDETASNKLLDILNGRSDE